MAACVAIITMTSDGNAVSNEKVQIEAKRHKSYMRDDERETMTVYETETASIRLVSCKIG